MSYFFKMKLLIIKKIQENNTIFRLQLSLYSDSIYKKLGYNHSISLILNANITVNNL